MYQFLSNKNIDKEQWDNVIEHSSQGQIYALTQYLDIFYPKWKGLVWFNESGKYKAVAPIFEKDLFLFKTCIQPPFIQQSGVFSQTKTEQKYLIDELTQFLKKRYFKLIYCLNVINSEERIITPHVIKTNYTLSINDFSVDQLNSNRKRELKKIEAETLHFKESKTSDFTREEFLHYCSKLKSIKLKHLASINRFSKTLLTRSFEIRDHNDTVLSKVLIGEFKNKIFYLLPVNYNKIKKGISTYMIIELLQYYSGKKEILDFEGGTVKNMAQFYQGFRSKSEEYKVLTH